MRFPSAPPCTGAVGNQARIYSDQQRQAPQSRAQRTKPATNDDTWKDFRYSIECSPIMHAWPRDDSVKHDTPTRGIRDTHLAPHGPTEDPHSERKPRRPLHPPLFTHGIDQHSAFGILEGSTLKIVAIFCVPQGSRGRSRRPAATSALDERAALLDHSSHRSAVVLYGPSGLHKNWPCSKRT